MLSAGCQAQLVGLTHPRAQRFNGKTVTLERWEAEAEKWLVRLAESGQQARIAAQNLELLDHAPEESESSLNFMDQLAYGSELDWKTVCSQAPPRTGRLGYLQGIWRDAIVAAVYLEEISGDERFADRPHAQVFQFLEEKGFQGFLDAAKKTAEAVRSEELPRRQPRDDFNRFAPADVIVWFRRFDANNDGVIDRSEFLTVLKDLGWADDKSQMLISAKFGPDNDSLDYYEFVTWIFGKQDGLHYIRSTFNNMMRGEIRGDQTLAETKSSDLVMKRCVYLLGRAEFFTMSKEQCNRCHGYLAIPPDVLPNVKHLLCEAAYARCPACRVWVPGGEDKYRFCEESLEEHPLLWERGLISQAHCDELKEQSAALQNAMMQIDLEKMLSELDVLQSLIWNVEQLAWRQIHGMPAIHPAASPSPFDWSGLKQLLNGTVLVRRDGTEVGFDNMVSGSHGPLILFLSTVDWCHHCSILVPNILKFYKELNKDEKIMEVILQDGSPDNRAKYFTEYGGENLDEQIPWLSMAQASSPLFSKVLTKNGWPHVHILDNKGQLVQFMYGSCRGDYSVDAYQYWVSKAQNADYTTYDTEWRASQAILKLDDEGRAAEGRNEDWLVYDGLDPIGPLEWLKDDGPMYPCRYGNPNGREFL